MTAVVHRFYNNQMESRNFLKKKSSEFLAFSNADGRTKSYARNKRHILKMSLPNSTKQSHIEYILLVVVV